MSPDLKTALDVLDRAIGEATIEQTPTLTAALAARIAALAARSMNGQATQARSDARDENLSVRGAAARLGVSVSWLQKHAGDLPFVIHIGRRVLFSARGLEKWNRQRQGR